MEIPTVKVARLDHDLVYFGLQPRPIGEVKPGDLVFCPAELAAELPEGARRVDVDCDLPAGTHRWNAEGGRFDLLPRAQRKTEQTAPDVARALYDFFWVAYQRDPTAVPPATLAWCLAYEKSVDALVSHLDEAPRYLNHFHAATGSKRK
jgi:hypothetical protein